MSNQVPGDRVLQRADDLGAGLVVGENGKVGVEHFVRRGNGELDTQPITGIGQRRRVDTVLCQPLVDFIDGLRGRSDKSLSLE